MRERFLRCISAVILVFLLGTNCHSQQTLLPIFQLAKLSGVDYPFRLGYSVAISGDTVVVGALYAPVGYTGAAYVYVKPAGGWGNMTQVAVLTPFDGTYCDLFGTSVAISGDTIIVGAPQTQCGSGPGKAYVFVKPAGGWKGSVSQTAELTASNGAPGDALGSSISISGDAVVAGAPGTSTSTGAAYVFVKPASGWKDETQSGKLTLSDGRNGDQFGYSVSLDGESVVAGAPFATIGSNQNQGAAYIFMKPPDGWKNATQTAKLTAEHGAAGDQLGYSVSIDGQTAVAGAPYVSIGPYPNQGAAYVFVEPSGGWKNMTQTARLTEAGSGQGEPAGDLVGSSIAIRGSVIAAGAAQYTRGLNLLGGAFWREGAVFVFSKPSDGWKTATSKIKATGSDARYASYLGSCVAVDGNTIVSGAPLNGHGLGWAYIFGRP
jgi:hypothetical protein